MNSRNSLLFFKNSECTAKQIYKHCRCVMFYQPVLHHNTSICVTDDDMGCVENVVKELLLENPLYTCECLNGCHQLHYDTIFSMASIFHRVPFLRQHNLDPKNLAILHTYFGRGTFRAHKRQGKNICAEM